MRDHSPAMGLRVERRVWTAGRTVGEEEMREERNMSPAMPEKASRWRWVAAAGDQGRGGGGVVRIETKGLMEVEEVGAMEEGGWCECP